MEMSTAKVRVKVGVASTEPGSFESEWYWVRYNHLYPIDWNCDLIIARTR